MQLGLYLPGLFALEALSGVQSLRILDRYELVPAHFPVAPASVHGERRLQEPVKAGFSAMVALSKLSNDGCERFEVRVLRRENGVAFEERNHAFEQIVAVTNHEDECPITLAIRSDAAATKPRADELEDLRPVTVLADMELRNELKSDATGRVALHRDREASFSVYITRDVAIQPFLLIVRTRHVVTIVNVRQDVDDE